MSLLNHGLVRLNGHDDPVAARARHTVIVSGVARSGTSMVARILQGAGLYMGERLDDAVFEDSDFALLFEHGGYDPLTLSGLVARRNADHRIWGFKRPHLHRQGPELIEAFRKPRVVLTMRDPVAIAERNAIAEHHDVGVALDEAAADVADMVSFARRLRCPVLLLSYEKAVTRPEGFLDRLLAFCGLPGDPARRQDLLRLVEPNRPAYVNQARRVFEGYVDRIDGTTLHGWAWQKGVPLPLPVTLLRDGMPVSNHMADHWREDLARAAIGSGRHGFSIDLAGQGFTAASRVGVKIGGRDVLLVNSGRTVAELGGTRSPAGH